METTVRDKGEEGELRASGGTFERSRTILTIALVVAIPSAAGQAAPSQNSPEITTHDQTVTFKTAVNLVNVPVVVRDSQGRAVGSLRREDFQLFRSEEHTS